MESLGKPIYDQQYRGHELCFLLNVLVGPNINKRKLFAKFCTKLNVSRRHHNYYYFLLLSNDKLD